MAIGNCAKMGLSMQDARELSWWEYQALVAMHQPDDEGAAVEPPDADMVAAGFERLAASGLVGSVH